MTRNKIISLLFTLLTCFSSSLVFAEGQIKLSHSVIDAYQSGDYQTISFLLTIDNASLKDFHRVKLMPSGNEFSSPLRSKLVNVGNLPAMGQAVIHWTVDTSLSVEYFNSGMPVFFVIKAKQQNGQNIEMPVYSHGGVNL